MAGFGGFGGGNFQMQQLMKQAQKMKEEMEEKQEELENTTFEAQSGGGMVKVEVNGKKDLLNITLNEQVVDKDDIEMLQDLIVAAVNEANKKVDEEKDKVMPKLY